MKHKGNEASIKTTGSITLINLLLLMKIVIVGVQCFLLKFSLSYLEENLMTVMNLITASKIKHIQLNIESLPRFLDKRLKTRIKSTHSTLQLVIFLLAIRHFPHTHNNSPTFFLPSRWAAFWIDVCFFRLNVGFGS